MFSQLLNGKQVAQILGISLSFAHQLMRQGVIPSVRIGRSIRVRQEDLAEFISSNTISLKIKRQEVQG
jgi:excisionase family DNA binding protein